MKDVSNEESDHRSRDDSERGVGAGAPAGTAEHANHLGLVVAAASVACLRRPSFAGQSALGPVTSGSRSSVRGQNLVPTELSESFCMIFTAKSIALAWLVTFGLFVLTAFGGLTSTWLFFLVLAGLAAPALILRSPVRAIAASPAAPGSPPPAARP
jgi:hypothetical protein